MPELSRRDLLNGVIAGAAAASLVQANSQNSDSASIAARPYKVIDTNLHLFQWPCRRLPCDTVTELVDKLVALDIHQAWAGSFEGLLHRDVAGLNQRLADACRDHGQGRLLAFGTINPTLPDWEDDLRRCREEHRMQGVRLYPNYHNYMLSDPRFERILAIAEERDLLVQICVSMEDRRTQHPRMQVPDVVLDPLLELMQNRPRSKVMLLNYKPTSSKAIQSRLASVPGLYFDTARVEGTDGIAKWMRGLPPDRVLWGTHAPFFVYESALIKVYESELSEREMKAVFYENAARLVSFKS